MTTAPDTDTLDYPAFHAAVDLVGRTGASDVEFGFLHDNVPTEEAGWWATAHFHAKGAKVTVEDFPGPVQAMEALAKQLIDGGKCTHCARPISLDPDSSSCTWARMGDKWMPQCGGKE